MRHISKAKRLALRVLMACTVGPLAGATEHVLDAALLEEILPSTFEHGGEPRYFVGPQHQD